MLATGRNQRENRVHVDENEDPFGNTHPFANGT